MKRKLLLSIVAVIVSFASIEAQEEGSFDPDLKYAQVRNVVMEENTDGSWTFSVTLRHADTGWDHYADLWQVIDEEGTVLGERSLAHPHTNEQPFTRGVSGVEIPSSVEVIQVRAKCNQHGYEGRKVRIPLDVPEGEEYTIHRTED